jgi:hypothetical protein
VWGGCRDWLGPAVGPAMSSKAPSLKDVESHASLLDSSSSSMHCGGWGRDPRPHPVVARLRWLEYESYGSVWL